MNNIYYIIIILPKAVIYPKNQVDLFQWARDIYLENICNIDKNRNENVSFSTIFSDVLLMWD